MGWSYGFDPKWNRDIGYGVPAICDHPDCGYAINRGLGYVCGGEPFGGENGCGLYFCGAHLLACNSLCERCEAGQPPYGPTPDTAEWLEWKLTDESWTQWRSENAAEAERIRAVLAPATPGTGQS